MQPVRLTPVSFNKSFSRYEDISSNATITEIDDETIDLIVEQLVQDIFNEAFVNW